MDNLRNEEYQNQLEYMKQKTSQWRWKLRRLH